jgi:hypothetical protein
MTNRHFLVIAATLTLVLSACNAALPKSYLIAKTDITTTLAARFPVDLRGVQLSEPLLEFDSQQDTLRLYVQARTASIKTGPLFVTTSGRLRYDNATRNVFLTNILIESITRFDGSPLYDDQATSSEVINAFILKGISVAINTWSAKHPIYTVPAERVIFSGYSFSIDQIKVVKDGLLLDIH